MKSRVPAIVGGIVGAVFVAFVCGIAFTILVILPVRGVPSAGAGVTPEPRVGPRIETTVSVASPAATLALIVPTPEPTRATATSTIAEAAPTAAPSMTPTATSMPTLRPTMAPSPTPTPRFPFYYVEGSRVEELQCGHPYLQGWVRDASGNPLDGVVIRWEYWGNTEYVTSGDPEQYWRAGEWKFTYGYGQKGFDPGVATDFRLQVVTSAENAQPLSEPLVIHYVGCHEMGQITNIVFKKR